MGLRLRVGDWGVDHDVVPGVGFVNVIGAGGEEEQRAADPDFPGIIGQVAGANAPWRLHHHIAWSLRAIPIAAREKIVLATIGHTVVAVREAVDDITGTILRPRAPPIAMPIRATGPVLVGAIVMLGAWPIARIAVAATGDIAVVTRLRLPGLSHAVGPALNRQVIARLLVLLRRTAMTVGVLGRSFIGWTTLALSAGFELATVVATDDFVVPGPGLLNMALAVATALVVVTTAVRAATVLLIIGHPLRTDTCPQQTNTCQTPDARLHVIPHNGSGPDDKTEKSPGRFCTRLSGARFISQALKKGDPSASP
ncbi:conserved membrane protein of unknown function [Pseudomonas mediterranea]